MGDGAPATTISVALCTYNGARYLTEQFESILQQTEPPDEVIISDDGSNDTTLSLARDFVARASFPVTLLASEGLRLGSTQNFERALRRCHGDLIALSDQDDRWRPERLARSRAAMQARPEATLLFSDAALIDEQRRPLPGSLWQRFGFAGERFRQFAAGDYSLLCRERFITGATVMLRRSALANVLPISLEWVHDAWLGILLSFQGDLIALNEPLIEYRVHALQQVGAVTSRWQIRATRETEAHWERIHKERLQASALQAYLESHPPSLRAELLPLYRARAAFLCFRDALPQTRIARIAPILRHWSGYSAHAGGTPSVMKDWLFARPSSLEASQSATDQGGS
jgi:glycosyltransferase involved in cell wall biosynthesis